MTTVGAALRGRPPRLAEFREHDSDRVRGAVQSYFQNFGTLHRVKTTTARNVRPIATCRDNQLLTGISIDLKSALLVGLETITRVVGIVRLILDV